MNKPTKAQRHAIYKKAMEVLDSGTRNYLCNCIKYVCFRPPYESEFPELFAQKPKRTAGALAWWLADDKGMAARRRALQRCIDLSAPTPRKTVGKTTKKK